MPELGRMLGRGLTATTKKSPAPSGGLRNPFAAVVFEVLGDDLGIVGVALRTLAALIDAV